MDEEGSAFGAEAGHPGARITSIHPFAALAQPIELDMAFFRDHFLGRPHSNHLFPPGPAIVSLSLSGRESPKPQFYLLIQTPAGSERLSIEGGSVRKRWPQKLLLAQPSVNDVLAAISHPLATAPLRPCGHVELPFAIL